MSELTAMDYEKIISFISLINSNYDRFIQNVLSGLSDIFGYRLSVYTILQMDSEQNTYVESVHSKFLSDEVLEHYKRRGYQNDLYARRLLGRMSSFSVKYIYTIEDIATSEEYFTTDFGRWMKDMNLAQRFLLKSPDVKFPCHVLTIFKAQAEELLNPREYALLNIIGRVFNESSERYRTHLKTSQFVQVIESYSKSLGSGVAVLDSSDNVVFYSDLFSKHASNISDKQNISAMVSDLVSIVCNHNNTSIEKISQPLVLLINGYQVDLRIDKLLSGKILETFYFLTTQKAFDSAQSFKYNPKLAQQYNFTIRELELIDFIIKGYSNAQMAEDLFITTSTVKFHIKNIFSKLGVTTRSSAISKILTFK